jgi:hypothetical protein
MGQKTAIAVIALVLVLIGGAVGAYAVDAAKRDQIAEGITIGGIDVGGLEAGAAKRLLHHELVRPLRRPVTVRFEDRRFKLTADRLRLRADLDEMVDEAISESREGGLPGRVVRYVTGGEVDERIVPQVSYSVPAIDGFVRRVAHKLGRYPVDASVSASAAALNVTPAEDGRKVRVNLLRRAILATVEHPSGSRAVTARVVRVKPDVTTDELAAEYPTYLTLDRYSFQLHLWKSLELVRSYTVAVGTVGFETPSGLYHIQNKAVDPAWSVPEWGGSLAGQVIPGGVPENPLKERWLGIYDGAGIHGTDQTYSLGTAASHGCVRMAIPDVIELYDQVPVGTPIYIG